MGKGAPIRPCWPSLGISWLSLGIITILEMGCTWFLGSGLYASRYHR
jgi:hypothetical protein